MARSNYFVMRRDTKCYTSRTCRVRFCFIFLANWNNTPHIYICRSNWQINAKAKRVLERNHTFRRSFVTNTNYQICVNKVLNMMQKLKKNMINVHLKADQDMLTTEKYTKKYNTYFLSLHKLQNINKVFIVFKSKTNFEFKDFGECSK